MQAGIVVAMMLVADV